MNTNLYSEGLLLKAYNSFYYVEAEGVIYTCSLRGRFRKLKKAFLPGDCVLFTELGPDTGVIEDVADRTNRLVRPAVANITTALAVFALSNPNPDLLLLDRMLIHIRHEGITPLICFNKADLVSPADAHELMAVYRKAGFDCMALSALPGSENGLEELKSRLSGGITVLCGPSGAGKSSIINGLYPGFERETNAVSRKSERGRHTTRRVELLKFADDSYIVDTPGFSVLDLPEDIEDYMLASYYGEFAPVLERGGCAFKPCFHHKERQCGVRDMLENGELDAGRYQRYIGFLQEIKERKETYR